MASVTILAFANSLPDLLMTSASDKSLEGTYFILGTLLGDFIFNSTITLSFVILKGSAVIHLDKMNLIKEIFFYCIALLVLLFFAYFHQCLNIYFVYAFLTIYLIYIFITLLISKRIDQNYSYIDVLGKSIAE